MIITESTPLIIKNGDDSPFITKDGDDSPTANVKLDTSKACRLALADDVETGETTNFTTMVHLLKANVGSGILGLPFAIKHGGIIVGPIFLLLVASMTVHCMLLLVRCSRFFSEKKKIKALSYGELAFQCSRGILKERSNLAKWIVNTFLVITQIGFCSTYLVLGSSTIVQIAGWDIEYRRLVTILLAGPCVLLSFIGSLNRLAYVSTLANLLVLFALISIFQYSARELKDPGSYPLFTGWKGLPVFLAMTTFSFEAISVILPLENKMKKREDFRWIVYVGMAIVTALYLLMALLGYIAFGDSINGSITLNLPPTYFYDGVKITYAVAMFLTYFIQFYVPVDILLPHLLKKFGKVGGSFLDYSFRALVVLLTVAAAVAIPQIENFISLIGAVGGSGLVLIFPPMFHMLTFQNNGLTLLEVVKDVVIMIMGLLGFSLGGYMSVVNIVKGFSTSDTGIYNSTVLIG